MNDHLRSIKDGLDTPGAMQYRGQLSSRALFRRKQQSGVFECGFEVSTGFPVGISALLLGVGRRG